MHPEFCVRQDICQERRGAPQINRGRRGRRRRHSELCIHQTSAAKDASAGRLVGAGEVEKVAGGVHQALVHEESVDGAIAAGAGPRLDYTGRGVDKIRAAHIQDGIVSTG